MKLHLYRGRGRDGGALVFTLLIMSVLCFLMASYLSLVGATNQSGFRSLAWNNAIPVVEGGIEEALAHLNKNGQTSLVADGWVQDASGFTKRLQLGTDETYCQTHISLASPPVIQAQGFVRLPLSAYTYLSRKVEVNTRLDSLFSKALATKSQVELRGNNLRTDSFDSSDPTASTGGLYDATKAGQNGDIAANAGVLNSQNVGSAEINGSVATGPGGTVALGAQGLVTGTVTDTMNTAFPDVEAPFTSAPSPNLNGSASGVTTTVITTGGTTVTTTVNNGGGGGSTIVIPSGNWLINGDLNPGGGSTRILITGNAQVLVTGNVNLSGSTAIEIATNATLKLYVAGPSTSLGGLGVINDSGNASQFQYYGLPTNTHVEYRGTTGFTGVIYAPGADVTLGDGGKTTYEFVGAATANSITLNGHHNFHFDTSLGHGAPFRGYVAVSWNEI